ncbi:tetratricopeptide repeat protein [Pseudoduganella lutea]|uniref:Tetratricopeptide repeat protein n=1 Tax=Pseudoduganella lutea TaxID=321985 RepID=A0A4P6L3S4_9BURK|nr:tetratricopeptide repeat protein [Pseudoduganella lutea]QBE65935.1 hypothetical protein EWM63_25550 [Pseudoduganella lutea]
MTISTLLPRIGVAAALVAALSACSTAPVVPPTPQLQDMLAEATKAATTGNKEQAIALWKQSAAAYPTDKAPWLSIAQTRYEAEQYGDAIQAALEVLVRDPNDQKANSIIAISGLRLSTRALNDLSRQNNLSGSIKTESQGLAKILRASLGEETLIVAPVEPPAVRDQRQVRTNKKAKTTKQPSGSSARANPFDALK